MRIFYLSTALEESDFAILNSHALHKINPAGQNFHNKLCHAIASFVQTEAYSLIPNGEGYVQEKTFDPYGPLRVTYIAPSRFKLIKAAFGPSDFAKSLHKNFPDLSSSDLIFYDSLNLTLSKAADILSKKYSCKKVAILTDSPYNLSGAKKAYQKRCLSLSSSCDGYFSLTRGLYDLFCKNGAPCLLKMGIAEATGNEKMKFERPYMYYGGALFVKDGTKALMDAYFLAKPNMDLYISGHGAYENAVKERAKLNPRVHYLGQISKQEHYKYINGASILLNPRIYRKSLDEVSVPSKLIEYLASGREILSTYSTPIFEEFGNSINLLESKTGDPTIALKRFFENNIGQDGVLKGIKNNLSPNRVIEELGEYAIGNSVKSFCESLISK